MYNTSVMYICSASTDLFRCFLEKFAITTYPRKGTETYDLNIGHGAMVLQLIPVRGRKPPARPEDAGCVLLQLIPVRGRKLVTTSRLIILTYYNLSPRGDGNSVAKPSLSMYNDYNLSPQGDGNSLFCDTTHWSPHYNLSPQGDNKAPPSLAFCQQRRCFVLSLFYLQVTGQVSCLRGWSL